MAKAPAQLKTVEKGSPFTIINKSNGTPDDVLLLDTPQPMRSLWALSRGNHETACQHHAHQRRARGRRCRVWLLGVGREFGRRNRLSAIGVTQWWLDRTRRANPDGNRHGHGDSRGVAHRGRACNCHGDAHNTTNDSNGHSNTDSNSVAHRIRASNRHGNAHDVTGGDGNCHIDGVTDGHD